MLLKTVYQWDIDSKESLATFREESLEIHRQTERTIYRRGDNVLPGELVERTMMDESDHPPTERTVFHRGDTRIFSTSRGEFLGQLNQDFDRGFLFEDDEYYEAYSDTFDRITSNFRDIPGRCMPRQIAVRATVEHRDGKPVRAEFLEIRGNRIADLPNPNAGGIRDTYRDENGKWSFVVEESDGTYRMYRAMYKRAREMYSRGRDDRPYYDVEIARPLMDTLERLALREMDDRDDLLMGFLEVVVRNER